MMPMILTRGERNP